MLRIPHESLIQNLKNLKDTHSKRSLTQGLKMAALISGYASQASLGKVLIRDREDRFRYFTENLTKVCQNAMKVLGFSIKTQGLSELNLANENYLFVCNHMSYLDVLVFSSVVPTIFVTSVDMGQVFFLGKMAELGGSLFIERRNRSRIDHDINQLADTLKSGFNIVIFPEGTSTDGLRIKPFKRSLLLSAGRAQKKVVPVAIKYMTIDGQDFGEANKDKMAWYGDMSFAPHFLELLKLKEVKVELQFGSPLAHGSDFNDGNINEVLFQKVQALYFAGRPAGFGFPREKMIEGPSSNS